MEGKKPPAINLCVMVASSSFPAGTRDRSSVWLELSRLETQIKLICTSTFLIETNGSVLHWILTGKNLEEDMPMDSMSSALCKKSIGSAYAFDGLLLMMAYIEARTEEIS